MGQRLCRLLPMLIFFTPHNKLMEMSQCSIHSAEKGVEVTELRKWW